MAPPVGRRQRHSQSAPQHIHHRRSKPPLRLVSKVLPVSTGTDRQAGNQVGVKKPGSWPRDAEMSDSVAARSNAHMHSRSIIKTAQWPQRWTDTSSRSYVSVAQIQQLSLGLTYTSLNQSTVVSQGLQTDRTTLEYKYLSLTCLFILNTFEQQKMYVMLCIHTCPRELYFSKMLVGTIESTTFSMTDLLYSDRQYSKIQMM